MTLVAAIVVIGARQFGLAVLMHEAAHWRLFRHAKVNDQVARWLCACPVGAVALALYRRRHHQHHRHIRPICSCSYPWKLRAAHALLLGKGYGPQMEIAPSYATVIRRVTAA